MPTTIIILGLNSTLLITMGYGSVITTLGPAISINIFDSVAVSIIDDEFSIYDNATVEIKDVEYKLHDPASVAVED